MGSVEPKLNQLDIISADPGALLEFYRLLGVEIPEKSDWRTQTGIHHASATATAGDQALDLDIDSTAFAQKWNSGWSGRDDLKGRVVVDFVCRPATKSMSFTAD
jgi:hypothetical protein